jgi:hypothetical protein
LDDNIVGGTAADNDNNLGYGLIGAYALVFVGIAVSNANPEPRDHN